jgi:hypothetical protein
MKMKEFRRKRALKQHTLIFENKPSLVFYRTRKSEEKPFIVTGRKRKITMPKFKCLEKPPLKEE